jgi:hypothetical protein
VVSASRLVVPGPVARAASCVPEASTADSMNGGVRPFTSNENAPLASAGLVRSFAGTEKSFKETLLTGASAETRPETFCDSALPPQPVMARQADSTLASAVRVLR